jgi:hypothetical protein
LSALKRDYRAGAERALSGFYARQEAKARAEVDRAERSKQRKQERAQAVANGETVHRYEHEEQKDVCKWLDDHGICHAANQEGAFWGDDGARRMAAAKARGFKKGRPDLEIFDAPPRFPNASGVALEMKSTDPKAKATPEQLTWLEKLTARGWVGYVAHGAADAVQWLESLGFGR